MANPLTFLLPLRFHKTQSVLVVQVGDVDQAVAVGRRARTLFPGCEVDALIREDDAVAVRPDVFDRIVTVRWEERFDVVRRLRARRYDAVAMLFSGQGARAYRIIPYLLRTRAILFFNDHLDYFPLNVLRLSSLAQHVSGHANPGALLRWAAGRAVVLPLATLFLLASTARIYLGAWRRHWGLRGHRGA
jgi:hypothetical protein